MNYGLSFYYEHVVSILILGVMIKMETHIHQGLVVRLPSVLPAWVGTLTVRTIAGAGGRKNSADVHPPPPLPRLRPAAG